MEVHQSRGQLLQFVAQCSFSSFRLLLLLLLQFLRFKLLRPPLFLEASNLPLHLFLLQDEVVACDSEVRDDFFR